MSAPATPGAPETETALDPWTDLRERLIKADAALRELSKGKVCCAYSRPAGKAEGVRLALGYMYEYERSAPELSLAEQRIVARFEASSWDSANDGDALDERLAAMVRPADPDSTAPMWAEAWNSGRQAVLSAASLISHFSGGVTTNLPRPTAATCAECGFPNVGRGCPPAPAVSARTEHDTRDWMCTENGSTFPVNDIDKRGRRCPICRPVSAGGQEAAEPRRKGDICRTCGTQYPCAARRAGVPATPANDGAEKRYDCCVHCGCFAGLGDHVAPCTRCAGVPDTEPPMNRDAT